MPLDDVVTDWVCEELALCDGDCVSDGEVEVDCDGVNDNVGVCEKLCDGDCEFVIETLTDAVRL